MRATVIPASELSPDIAAVWSGILSRHPALQTPLLHPEVYRVIGKHQPRVSVAVGMRDGQPSHFLPFERARRFSSFAGPVPFCDYQAVVTATSDDFQIRELLRASALQTWSFDHLLGDASVADQATLVRTEPARRVTLPRGFDAYVTDGGIARKPLRNVRSRLKQVTRDRGELMFTLDDRDPAPLADILRWKASRFDDGGPAMPSLRAILEELHATRIDGLEGVLSTLRAGDALVAAHFGVRGGATLFHWFPAFNPEFAKYGPGLLLLLFMLEKLHELQCDTLDFGPGGEEYKSYFSNAEVPVSGGYVELPSVLNVGRATWRSIDHAVRTNPLSRSILRPVVRTLRRVRR